MLILFSYGATAKLEPWPLPFSVSKHLCPFVCVFWTNGMMVLISDFYPNLLVHFDVLSLKLGLLSLR